MTIRTAKSPDDQYLDMVNKLRPFSWKYLNSEQQQLMSDAIDAGEPYSAMVVFLWYAVRHGAGRGLIQEAYDLLEDEDKPDFRQSLNQDGSGAETVN